MTDLLDRMVAARDGAGDCAATRFARLTECLVLYHTHRRELSFVCERGGRAVVTMCMSVANWFRPDGPARPSDIARSYTRFSMDIVRGTVPSEGLKGGR